MSGRDDAYVPNGHRGPRRDPLVALLRAIREQHKISQLDVELCMELPADTIRHIERYRRPLPDVRRGLATWVRHFLNCVGATPEEKRLAHELASNIILAELADILDEG